MEVEIENQVSIKQDHQDTMEQNVVNSNTIVGLPSVAVSLDNQNGSVSEMSYQDDENEGDQSDPADDDCDNSDCSYGYGDDDDDEYLYENNDDDYVSMQAQFDNVDLPPGVEASFSWMQTKASHSNSQTPVDASSQASLGVETSTSLVPAHLNCNSEASAANNPSVCAESSSSGKEKEEVGESIRRKYISFKQFDVVTDHSEHHYCKSGFEGREPPRDWIKKIQNEWKILKKDLPDTIYVRVYESRMDLLRAVIVGPQGTPYHDGLFVYDISFPPTYPSVPPMVYYYSGGLRLDPNLYDCGKVCLSLLNTWSGKGNEKWVPNSSTMLQVLVSIQALILNAKPFFNEPVFENRYVGQLRENKSKAYNEDVFILSLKTMMYGLKRPPKHFEDLVAGHYLLCAHDILSACRAYMEGTLVGSLVNGKVPEGTVPQKGGSSQFKAAVGRLINGLIENFSRSGVPGCDQFRVQFNHTIIFSTIKACTCIFILAPIVLLANKF